MSKSLLIIDDEANMRHMLKSLLHQHSYIVTEAANGRIALDLLQYSTYDFILCDIKMPILDGMGFLKRATSQSIQSTIIMMSAYGTVDLAVEAMKNGAYDYISKPFKTDEVILTLKKAEERKQLKFENKLLRNEIKNIEKQVTFLDVIGASPPLKKLLSLAEKVAQYDTSVLITGESGTGKELIARGIHNSSPRSAHPLITINCASIPIDLLESEFFGFTKGAFTGAETNKIGLLKEAHEGTLFLDEIGELPIGLQAKLLRVLQDGEIRALGANITEKVNVRIVAATARNLHEEVKKGRFRQDLFFRLNVVELTVPPLRERTQDIPLLAQHFVQQLQIKIPDTAQQISASTIDFFRNYPWPGNIRELKNVIEYAMIYCDGNEIINCNLPPKMQHSTQPEQLVELNKSIFSIKSGKIQLEKKLIVKALQETAGNKSRAAELLEVSYPSLLAKIKEYGIF